MEFKKKTIIWEENTEPPKNYYWIKPDNKVYEFDIEEGDWIESEEITYTPSNKTAGGYSMNETSEEVSSTITSYEDSQRAALATYIEQQQNNLQTRKKSEMKKRIGMFLAAATAKACARAEIVV